MSSSAIDFVYQGYEDVLKKVKLLAEIETGVIFLGETGSGKDFWANYLARLSGRKPFLNLHCGQVDVELFESEWFGYHRGAFSGAIKDFSGRLKQAEGGIILLNQLDLLPLVLQAKILRLIEQRTYFQLGEGREVQLNARLIFSADSSLAAKVKNGHFRSDLYYRVMVNVVELPALRERPELIGRFFDFFVRKYRIRVAIDSAILKKMLFSYKWPGNIRELESLVIQAIPEERILTEERLEKFFQQNSTILERAVENELSLEELSLEYVRFICRKYRNKTKAAKVLKISRKKLYSLLKKRDESR